MFSSTTQDPNNIQEQLQKSKEFQNEWPLCKRSTKLDTIGLTYQ